MKDCPNFRGLTVCDHFQEGACNLPEKFMCDVWMDGFVPVKQGEMINHPAVKGVLEMIPGSCIVEIKETETYIDDLKNLFGEV